MLRLPRSRWAMSLLIAASLVACASEEERFENHMKQGEAFHARGQIKEAILEVRLALKIQPQNALVNERLGNLYLESGRFEDAVFFYREAQSLDPQRVGPLLSEFQVVLGADLERAAELIKKALELAPDNPSVHQRRSALMLAGGSTEKALEAALTAIELAPEDPASHLALGTVHQARIREHQIADEEVPDEIYKAAIEAFERADEVGKGFLPARIEIARTLGGQPGRGAETYQAFHSALELARELEDRPHQLLIAEEIALRARRLKEPVAEKQALETLIALDPATFSPRERWALGDPDARIQRAWSGLADLSERHEPGSGAAVIGRLLEQQPENVRAHLLYTRFLSAHERRDEALQHLVATADRGIEPARLLDEAVQLCLESNRVDEASRYLERLEAEHPDHPRTLLAGARLALVGRDFIAATKLLGRVNEAEETAESQHLLALAELQSGKRATALQAINRSLELDPNNPVSLSLQARLHFEGGDWTGLLTTLRRLRAAGTPLRMQEQLYMVQALYELGRSQTARARLEQILETDPPPEAAVVLFARNEFQSQPEKTARLLEEALARRPESLPLLSTATAVDLRRGEVESALARLNRAIEKQPEAAIPLALRAQVLASANRLEEAEKDASQAFELNPTMPHLVELLLAIYERQGRIEVAIEQLEASEKSALLGLQHRVLLGRLHLTTGNTARARELYEAALAEDPDLAGAKNDLAFLLAREGQDLDRALRLAQEAQQKFSEEPTVMDTLGYVMLRRGLAGPAAEQLSSAIRLAEERGGASAELHYHMGLTLRALGQEEAAAQHLTKALSIDPEFIDAEEARRQLEEANAAASQGDTPAS